MAIKKLELEKIFWLSWGGLPDISWQKQSEWKSVMETNFSYLNIRRHDLWGHVTRLLQVKMACFVSTGKETQYFLQVIKEKNNNQSYNNSKQT